MGKYKLGRSDLRQKPPLIRNPRSLQFPISSLYLYSLSILLVNLCPIISTETALLAQITKYSWRFATSPIAIDPRGLLFIIITPIRLLRPKTSSSIFRQLSISCSSMLMKIAPSSVRKSLAIFNLGYIILSQSVWNLPLLSVFSTKRFPASSVCPLFSTYSSAVWEKSSSQIKSFPVLYGGSM